MTKPDAKKKDSKTSSIHDNEHNPLDANDREIWEGKVLTVGVSVMPEEYKMLLDMRRKLMAESVDASASDLLRAGLIALNKLNHDSLIASIVRLQKLKKSTPELNNKSIST